MLKISLLESSKLSSSNTHSNKLIYNQHEEVVAIAFHKKGDDMCIPSYVYDDQLDMFDSFTHICWYNN